MTQAQEILDYLWSIAPEGATNSQIASAVGISSHQTVYMTTQELMHRRRIRGEQRGRSWYFFALDNPEVDLARAMPPARPGRAKTTGLSTSKFESLARSVMSQAFNGADLPSGQVGGVPKEFDFVSTDQQIVGDAKYCYGQLGRVGQPMIVV